MTKAIALPAYVRRKQTWDQLHGSSQSLPWLNFVAKKKALNYW